MCFFLAEMGDSMFRDEIQVESGVRTDRIPFDSLQVNRSPQEQGQFAPRPRLPNNFLNRPRVATSAVIVPVTDSKRKRYRIRPYII